MVFSEPFPSWKYYPSTPYPNRGSDELLWEEFKKLYRRRVLVDVYNTFDSRLEQFEGELTNESVLSIFDEVCGLAMKWEPTYAWE